MRGEKIYLQPMEMMLNAIHDLAELQKAKTPFCDSPRGIVHLRVTMYESEWEYRFTVTDIGWNRSGVAIGLSGETRDAKRLIDHEFALLDYVLADRAKIELTEIKMEEEQQ